MFRLAMGFACLVFLASCATTLQVTPAARSDLAPTGKLRVGINYGNPLFATRNRATGEASGIAIDLARELGRRMGMPVELVGYDSGGQLTAGLKAGGWDVAFLAYEQAREAEITFAAAFAEVDSTYLVPAGSKLRTVEAVDSEGIRVAVSAKGGNDLFLSRTLKRAQLVRVPGSAAAFKMFVADNLDAFAGLRPELMRRAANLPGSRVLDGRFTVIQYSVSTPKGRDAGAEYLRRFVEDVKASGLVAQMIDRSGVRGLTVPLLPPTVRIGGGSM
jgi:polar amino acid transport system substrate-binding protein